MAKKKRYHESERSRYHEHAGEERYLHGYHKGRGRSHLGSEYYAGMDSREREERRDAGMISEDHSAPANLPQHVIMRPYERGYSYTPEDIDDTIRGIDGQIGMDDRKRNKHMVPKKV